MKRGGAKRIDQDEVYRLHISGMNNHEIASLVGCTSINVSWILRTKFSVSPKIIFHPKCQWTNKNFESIDKSTIDKILNNINKRENDECWEFNGTINKHGYGEFRKVLAHRVSYEVHVGHVGSAIVGHRCNNKKCCNPKHLYLTNYSENIKYGYESRSVSAKQDY